MIKNHTFNSIKVQLSPKWSMPSSEFDASFNSIKVQLSPDFVSRNSIDVQIFQFHKGTIKPEELSSMYSTHATFNSIKVQLSHKV